MTKFSTKLNLRILHFDQVFLLDHEIHDDRKIQLKVEPPNLLVPPVLQLRCCPRSRLFILLLLL